MPLHKLGNKHQNRYMRPSPISDSVDPRRAVAWCYTLHPQFHPYYRYRPPMTDVVHAFNNLPNRSRSSSSADAPSPGSSSSDSHSSSDPDLHLTALSSSWSNSSPFESTKQFQTDLTNSADQRCLEFDSPLSFSSFHTLHPFPSPNYDMDDIILAPEPSSSTPSRSDMLKLEELLDDASYDQPISVAPSFIYPSYLTEHHGTFLPSENKEVDNPFAILANTCDETQRLLDPMKEPNSLEIINSSEMLVLNQQQAIINDRRSPSPSNITQPSTSKTPNSSPSSSSSSSSSAPALSSNVVYPPKDICNNLPILFPGIPTSGTKSRVETQIKLAFELAIPLSISSTYSSTYVPVSSSNHLQQTASSSNSNSRNGTPSPRFTTLPLPGESDRPQRSPTHDRVGSYKYLRLPNGTVTKRRSANPATAKKEAKVNHPAPEEVLQMTAEVVCSSPPHGSVQSCESCQAREAKRTARKLAARVRPAPGTRPKSKSKSAGKKGGKKQDTEGEDQDAMEEDYEEPNVDNSIIQFNCGETLNFSTGSVVLPMRITCYCRHHKEKIGFNIVFTLTDYQGRVVGRGTTPPILITDDHKSVNAVSKLPPMHPLRQNLNVASMPPIPPLLIPAEDESLAIVNENSQPASPHLQLKRRDHDANSKKRRSKPYDGRPPKSTGTPSNIEGRPGVVLALHPAHSRKNGDGSFIQGSLPGTRSPTPSEPTFIPISQSMNGSHHDGGSPSLAPGTPLYQLSPRAISASTLSTPVLSQGQSGSSGSPPPGPFTPEQQPYFDAKALYPSFSFPMEPPRIHRLIPSSGPTTGGIEITVLGSNFHASLPLECVFGGVVASSTHRWSDNTLVCLLPPRATPGAVSVEIRGIPPEMKPDGAPSFFHYVDESDRQLMELALQVVGLKMTGKIEEARNVAMRIVGNSGSMGEMNGSSDSFTTHSLLGSLTGVDLESLVIKLLTLLDVPLNEELKVPQSSHNSLDHKNATGQTLLHLAVFLALPSLVSCIIGRGADVNARNNNGMTPLHFAALIGWKEGAEILLSEGAEATIVDRMGCTPAERARLGDFADVESVLRVSSSVGDDDIESGVDGDDEGCQSDGEESEDEEQPPVRLYKMGSRTTSSTHLQMQEQVDPARSESPFHHSRKDADTIIMPDSDTGNSASRPEQPPRSRSFVKRLQRTLPQKILPSVQIPGLQHIQLRDMPWGLSQIPVFPIYVPLMPWLNVPRTDELTGDKKDNLEGTPGEKHHQHQQQQQQQQQQQHSLAMLWAAYHSIANNNGWRNQWEKWSASTTAMQNANPDSAVESELPPYSPRQPDTGEEVLETKDVKEKADNVVNVSPLEQVHPPPSSAPTTVLPENKPPVSNSSSSSSIGKNTERLGHRSSKGSSVAYRYKPTRKPNKQDRMLVLFWIPILLIGIAYALYTILPTATKTVFQGTRLMSHKLLRV